jgi:hypothetical protein
MRKRKFFAEIMNACREHQVQLGTTHKQRKQRNDGVLVWLDIIYLWSLANKMLFHRLFLCAV